MRNINKFELNGKKQVCFIDLKNGHVFFPVLEKFHVGRDESCELFVEKDHSVSRVHASVVVIGHTAAVRDLESTNGTYLNDVRVDEPFMVKIGDEVRFGLSTFIFASRKDGETLLSERTVSACVSTSSATMEIAAAINV